MLVRLVELSDSEAHFCVYNVLEVITKARVSENGDWVSDPRRSSPCTLTSKWRGSGVSCQGAFRHPAFVLAHIWLPYSVGWVWLRRRQVRLSALLPSQLSPNNSMRSWEPERNVQGCATLSGENRALHPVTLIMGRLNFSVDEASLLKAYRISSLAPT